MNMAGKTHQVVNKLNLLKPLNSTRVELKVTESKTKVTWVTICHLTTTLKSIWMSGFSICPSRGEVQANNMTQTHSL